MTRDEAIKQIAESYNEAKADYEENEVCYSDKSFIDGVYQGATSACFYIKQIDESNWHKVSEEGNPKEEGLYVLAILYQRGVEHDVDKWTGSKWDWFEEVGVNIVAWQKITPYEG